MLYLIAMVTNRLNILIFASFFVLNVYAQNEVVFTVDEEVKVEMPDSGNDNEIIKTSVDYKTQIEILRPKLGDKKIEEVQNPWIAYVKSVEGKVLIKRHNKAGDIVITFSAEEKDLLTNSDVVDIGSNGRVELEFKNKDIINLGPSTVLKIEQKNAYTLLVGSLRVRAPKNKKESKTILVYAPNVNVSSENGVDFVVRYDDKLRTSNLVCFNGKFNARGIRDSKEQKGFEKNLVRGDRLDVITTNEKDKEVYIATEPEKLSMDSKRQILESFYSDPTQVDLWEYRKLSTSFFRFATSFEYARFREVSDTAYANFTFGYVPLVYLGSVFYLEPYFHISFANPFSLLFYRAGAVVQVNIINGLYFGLGGGAFWIHKESSKYGADFTTHLGYTFAEKVMGFIDGFRMAYFMSQASGLHERAFMFSMVINFSAGRELY